MILSEAGRNAIRLLLQLWTNTIVIKYVQRFYGYLCRLCCCPTSFQLDADALVLYRGSDGDLHPMKINDDFVVVKVVNRYEHFETIPAETYGAVLKQDGEWHPAGADCDAAGTSLIPAELIVAPPESPP